MTSLLNPQVRPHFSAMLAEPLTAVEIDEHVDCARIWATVAQVREDLDRYEAQAMQRTQDAEQGERDARAILDNTEPPPNMDEIEAAFDDLVQSGFKQTKFKRLQVAIKGE